MFDRETCLCVFLSFILSLLRPHHMGVYLATTNSDNKYIKKKKNK